MKTKEDIEKAINSNKITNFYSAIKCINSISSLLEKEVQNFDDVYEIISQSKSFQSLLETVIKEVKTKKIELEEIGLSETSISIVEMYKLLTNSEEKEQTLDYSLSEKEYNLVSIYISETHRFPILTAEEERELITKYYETKDKKIKKKLVNHNLRLVINIAKHYQGRGMELLDLIQEGNIGLIEAIDSFDPEKAQRLSTYAVWRIRQFIGRAIRDKSKTIRVPDYLYDIYEEYKAKKQELEYKLGRDATTSEIAEYMNIKEEKVLLLITTFTNTTSLEAQIGEDSETEFQSMLKDDSALDPEMESVKNSEVTIIKKCIDTLSDREKEVLILRFGLDDGIPKTLEETAEKMNCTKERVRQLESKALRRIRIKVASYHKPKTLKSKTKKITSIREYLNSYGIKNGEITEIVQGLSEEKQDVLYGYYYGDILSPRRINEEIDSEIIEKIINEDILPSLLEKRKVKNLTIKNI